MPRATAAVHLVKLLKHTESHKIYPELFKRQCVHVTEKGGIRFYPEKDPTGYVEYEPVEQGGYRKQIQGNVNAPFFQRRGRGEELQLFVDAATFLKRYPTAMMNRSSPASVLALLEPNIPLVRQAATERSIKRLRLVCDQADAKDPELVRFRDELALAMNPFSIDVSMAWEPSLELSMGGLERESGRDMGRDRLFHGI